MRKICVMLVLLGLVICGAWGAEASKFRWTRIADGFWQNGNSWEYEDKTDNQWKNADDWPCTSTTDDANDSVFINTNEGEAVSYTIKLTEDVKLEALNIDTKNGTSVTIDLNGHNLIANTMALGHVGDDGASGSATSALTFIITDSSSSATKGSFSTGTVHLTSSSTNSVIRITNDVSVNITSTLDNTSSSQSGRLSVTGDGTGSFNTPGGTSEAFVTVNSNLVNHNGNTVPTPIATDTYYWTGNANDGNIWTTSGNWAPNADGSGLVTADSYPGHADNETAVFGENVSEIKDFQIGSESENWTIYLQNNAESTDYKGVRITSITHNNEQIVINENSKGAFWFNCANESKVGSIHVKNGGVRFQTGSLIIEGDLQIETGVDVVSWNTFSIDGKFINNGIISFLGGSTYKLSGNCENSGKINLGNFNLELNGGYSGTGTLSVSSGTITFGTGTTNTVSNLAVSDTCKIQNNSDDAVILGDVTLPDTAKDVTFTGKFKSTGKFLASPAGTYFINGNVDFSNCTEFSINGSDTTGATVFFYNMDSTSRTFTTQDSMKFSNFYFAGNVNIDLKGDVEVTYKCMMSALEDYKQTSPYMATITGTGNLKAAATGDGDGALSFAAGSDEDKTPTSIRGTLVIDADVNCAQHFGHYRGKSVIINKDKKLTVGKDYRGFDGSNDEEFNEISINGTVKVTENFGAGEGKKAILKIGKYGNLTAGGSVLRATFVENSHIIELNGGSSVFSFGSYTGTDDNSVKIHGGSIICSDPENNGTIGSILFLDGTTNVSYSTSSDVDFKIGNVVIAENTIFSTDVNLAVSSTWVNNNTSGGFVANEKTVTFENPSSSEPINITVSKTTFYKAVFKSSTDFSSPNEFKFFECKTGDVSLIFRADQTVTDSLSLEGAENHFVSLSSPMASSIIVPKNGFSADYLSIDEKIIIKEGSVVSNGSHKAYTNENKKLTSKPSAGNEPLNYAQLFQNGWDLGYDFVFTWQGTTSAWSTDSNWDLGVAPGLSSKNTEGVKVLIPDGVGEWPQLYTAQVKLKSLTIGTSTSLSHDARIIINVDRTGASGGGSLNIENSDTTQPLLTNYGTIEYKGSSRIMNGTSPLNDTLNGGTVEYSGTSAQTVTKFASSAGEDDYANLLITGTDVSTADSIQVGENLSVSNKTSPAQNGVLKINEDLTLRGNLVIGGGCSFEVDTGKSVIFAETGASAQELSVDSGVTKAEFANVKIESGAKVQSAGSYTVTENWTNENSIDSGTGGFTASTGTITFTGSSLSITGKNNFNNLIFADGAGGTVTDKISVTGTTSIANGTGKELSLTGENSFTGHVIIGDSVNSLSGGKITLNSDGNLQLAEVTCDSLEVQSSVTFTENVASPVTFTGSGAQINGNGKTFSKAVTFSGPSATLNGNNTFSGTVTFSGDGTTLSGDNNFNGNVTCATGGVTLTFADGSIQNMKCTSAPTAKLVLKGAADSRLELSGNAKIVVPKNTNSRTYFEGEYLSIPSNLVITSDSNPSSPVDYGAYSVLKSVPSEPASPNEQDAYITLFKNGWDLGYTFSYVWTGNTDSSWSEKSNWNIGIVPGIQSSGVISGLSGKTTGAKVSIPDGLSNYPEVDVTGGVRVQSLVIGSDVGNPHNSSIKLTSNPVSVTETDDAGRPLFTNFGTIEYTGAARITNDAATPLPINDAANNGTVMYSGGTQASPLEISTSASSGAAEADYANLVIKGIVSNPSPVTVSGPTLIELAPTAEISLVSANTFSGPVTIKSGKSIALTGANKFDGGVIVDAADSSVSLSCGLNFNLGNSATITKCKDLTLSSPAGISISAQNEINLSGKLTLSKNTTLSLGSKNLTFASYSCAVDKSDTIEANSDGSITQTGATSSTIGKLNLTSGSSPYSLNGGTGGLVINSADYGSSSIITSGNVTLAGTTSPDKIDVLKISAGKTILSGDNFVSSVEIDSGAVLQTGTASASTVHLSVNGDWTNNAGELGFVANSGTVEFTSSATISGNNSFNKAVFDEDMLFGGNSSFSEFVCESAGKSLTFAPGSNQTVTELTIRGTETGKINLTGIGEWQITPLNHAQISIAHAIITNSKNTDSEPIIVYAKNGYNTDGTGNTNWIFAGHKYIWTGAASTDWDTTSNWSPASVPREYADVEILGGKTNYPKLTQDLNLKNDEKIFVVDTNGDGINENESVTSSVAIDSGAVFDFAGNNLTVNALSSEGRIRVLGTEIIAAAGDSGIKNLPLDSSSVLTGVIEYYGDFGTRVSPNFGDKFSLLEFTEGSSGQISGAISVSGETLISNGAGKSLELTGDNTFAGDVKISGAGNVTIKGQKSDTSPLSLTGAVDSSKLTIKSDVVLNGNVTTADTQDYEGKVTLNAGIVFNAADSRLSFGSDILSGNENSALTFESPASLGGNVTTALSQTYKKNLTLLADVIFTAGAGVKFDSASELSITSDKSAKFKSPLSANCDLAITVSLFDFDSNASFKHTDSTKALTLKSGTALTFKNVAFDAGKLIIDEGASFTQTGVNLATAVQKVSAIENNGSCVWDSGSEGGSLLLAGSISGSKADQIIFNKKNVSLSATPITISGVFFDLTVPGGINATNGSGLVVRRNFTVSGSYLHNSQSLTLGSVTFDDGRKYASANNDDGSAGLISSPSNLGSVKIVQEGSGKKFTSNIEGLSFSLDDASVAAGSIEFAEKLKALSLTNAENTNFAILFDSACEITEAVTFGTSGNVILGTKEDSACLFANTLEHTAGDTKLAGSIQSFSAKFARTLLTQNVKIDCGLNSVIFTGDLDSDSSDSPRALSIGNESSLTSVKFEKTCGLVNPLASLLVYGNAEFGGNLISEGIVNLKGKVISFADVSLLSKKSYILLDGQNSRTVGAASGSLTFASDLFVDMDTEASLTLSSDITWLKIFCGYSGKITSGAVKLSGKDLILFGPAYNPDDPRYSGSDSRFAYFGYDSLDYKPASASLGFKSEFLTSGSQVILSGNFYANGLDLSGASFVIPNQAASNPLFNSSGDVTERQWGLPYAVAFNSEISNCSASSPEGSAFVTAAKAQNVTDKSGNSGFQFELPQISGAHSVSDSVICLTFDMALENSKGEVSSTIALVSSLEKGGIFYNGKSLAFDGKFYTESDGTDCSIPLSESSLALTDIPAFTPLYLKVSSAANNWNTDATASSAGSEDSTDRSGIHRNRTTDLSLFEGLFFAADGKTMCRNYGIGQWSENYADYSDAPIFATVDRARPVLVDLFTGQELHSTNTGTADSQKFYDSHNFIELRYSEPVDIGNLLAGAGEQNQNQQAQTEFNSAEKHGGAITNNSGSGGLTLAGFVSIEKGELTSGYKSGSSGSYSFNSDTNKAHALYRKFSKNAGDEEQIFPSRVRISVAGYVDEENPISLDGAEFHNWIGYIDSSTSPAGQVIPLANKFITDLAVDSEGQPVKNIFDENNSSRSLSVNDRESSSSSSLYGDWDCSHPVFAAYVTNFNDSDPNVSWNYGDSDYRQYEMLGTVNSNTNAYIDTIEMHLFDNTQNYSADDLYKWAARKGWSSSGSSVIPGFEAPESAGGSRAIPQSAAMTHGGIRRSSLDGAISAFTYKYSLDDFESDFRPFAERDISQHVKSPIFRGETLSETFTDNDQPYLGLTINTNDSKLPIRTTFTVTYEPKKSFITDLAGNRLLHTDSGSDKKILHTIDITPPSFTMTISPVGENKIYAVFTKPLAYKGTYLSELGGELPSVLEKIASNLEFVYSEEDNVDTASAPDGDKAISILSAELAVGNMDYTAILFTLDRKISLDDVEKIWIRINDLGEGTATLFGDVTASYIQDKLGNPVPVHTCHALSDFAINAVNMLYAYSDNTDDDGWDEHEIYGQGLAPESSDYAVHDFSEDGENYNRLRSERDIVFQFEFFDSEDDKGKSALKNGESLALVYDEKSNIRPEWKGSKYNLLTEGDWRIWLDNPFEAFSLSYNPSPLSASLPSPPLFADVEGSDILKNMTWRNEDFNIEAGKEYQFFFKILDSSGNIIQINHDGDTRTPRIPLYTFRMPKERIAAGDFSYLDLWSLTTRDLTRQRGGVTILNNVINAAIGEKTAVEVNMKGEGNLNVFVMTLDGNIIKRLSKGSVKAGTHYFYWDGKNGAGKPVARGLYFIRVSGNGIDETRKVMVVK